MSIKSEQYRSLLMTRNFLRELLDPKLAPKTRKEMKSRVSRCLRHYPFLEENGKPMFSKDNFPT